MIVAPRARNDNTALSPRARRLHVQAPDTPDGGDPVAARLRSDSSQISGCPHLKSGVTRVADGLLLLNPDWVDRAVFHGYRAVDVDPAEPHAANALALGGTVVHPMHFPLTGARLEAEGLRVEPLEMTEMAKAEAGVTCCSLILRTP